MNPSKRTERILPTAYAVIVLALVVLLLPTALRPPKDPANASPEFSPDAPPDDQESIVAVLNRGSSSTAGDGVGQGPSETAVGPNGVPLPPELVPDEEEPPVMPKAVRSKCFGNPPRQTQSLYAASCAAAFSGDNGGATDHGVTASEVRVGVFIPNTDDSPEGPVSGTSTEYGDTQRAYRVFESYFNTNYEFYGRQLRIFLVKAGFTDAPSGTAAAVAAKRQHQVFGTVDTFLVNAAMTAESIRLEMVNIVGFQGDDYFSKHRPYAWSFIASNDRMINLSTELVCKQFTGKPPSFNDRRDKSFDYDKPRKFGMILVEDENRTGVEARIKKLLAACGTELDTIVKFNLNENLAGAGGAMTKMKAAGVTSVLMYSDHITANFFAGEATRLDYWPEWIVPGTGGVDVNSLSYDQDQEQWKHAFGLSLGEIARQPYFKDDTIAYQSIDPEGDYFGVQGLGFVQLTMLANGIQSAGPELNERTFERGMQSKVPVRPPVPVWSVGGGFEPGDYTYSDYASLIWWDPAAVDATTAGKGAYRHVGGGKRYAEGEIPTTPVPFFSDGIETPDNPTIPDEDEP